LVFLNLYFAFSSFTVIIESQTQRPQSALHFDSHSPIHSHTDGGVSHARLHPARRCLAHGHLDTWVRWTRRL